MERRTVFKIVLLLALLTIVMYGSSSLFSSIMPKPPIDVIPSIDHSSIDVGQRATITIDFKNNDLKTHDIQLIFVASPKISFFAGSENTLTNNAYSFRIDATSPSDTRAFTLTALLDSGESSTTYTIILRVYVDGTELQRTWKDFSLVVSR